jgi:signal transduction histidine kinase
MFGLSRKRTSAVAKLHGGRLLLNDNGPGLSATIELPALVQAEAGNLKEHTE